MSEDTKWRISFSGGVWATFIAIVGAAWVLSAKVSDIQHTITDVQEKQDEIDRTINKTQSELAPYEQDELVLKGRVDEMSHILNQRFSVPGASPDPQPAH